MGVLRVVSNRVEFWEHPCSGFLVWRGVDLRMAVLTEFGSGFGTRLLPLRGDGCSFSLSAAVVSNAVSHVVAIEDTFVYRDGVAGPLTFSGLVALAAALSFAILTRRREPQDSQSAMVTH